MTRTNTRRRSASADLSLGSGDLFANPAARLPVCIVLDTSGSMFGRPITELKEALKRFVAAVDADEDARDSCEMAVISAGGDVTVHPIAVSANGRPAPSFDLDRIEAAGQTPLGEAVVVAMSLLTRRKAELKATGVPYYQPWLVIVSDGQPTDDTAEAEEQTRASVRSRSLTVIPVAVGGDADTERLQALAGGVAPHMLSGLDFGQLFSWLSASLAAVSRSTPGAEPKIAGALPWAQHQE